MASIVDATCSECFLTQQVELNPRRSEIQCQFCNHSVPMFERRDMDAIRSGLALERRKTYIALIFFLAAGALFGLYVLLNVSFSYRDDRVSIEDADGATKAEGFVVERKDGYVVIEDPETGEQGTHRYKRVLADEVARIMEEHPLMTEAEAVKSAGDTYVGPQPRKMSAAASILLIFAVLAALGAVVTSAIASSDHLICEF